MPLLVINLRRIRTRSTIESMKKSKEPTIRDVVELIDNLAITVANGFERVDKRFNKNEIDVGILKTDVGTLRTDMETVKRDVSFIRSNFVNREEFEDLVKRVVFLEGRVGTKLGTRKLA